MIREARYELQREIANHDFFYWLVVARELGYQRVVFGIQDPKQTKWPEYQVIRRFMTILAPGSYAAGMDYRIGDGGAVLPYRPMLRDFLRFLGSGKPFTRLRGILPPRRVARYTVTLRNHWRAPERNCNTEAWLQFAHEIAAYVIQDYDDDPIPLYEKQAIYEAAEMNFGVNTGPFGLLGLTAAPMTMVITPTNYKIFEQHGIKKGSQYPWALPNQRLLWMDDSFDNLKACVR